MDSDVEVQASGTNLESGQMKSDPVRPQSRNVDLFPAGDSQTALSATPNQSELNANASSPDETVFATRTNTEAPLNSLMSETYRLVLGLGRERGFGLIAATAFAFMDETGSEISVQPSSL